MKKREDKIKDENLQALLLKPGITSFKRYAALIVSVLFAPLLIRVALIFQKNITFSTIDLHGFISDILVSLVVALFLVFIFRLKLLLGIVVVIFLSLLNYGAYEHVMALGALPSLSNIEYLADTTFLKASVLTVSNPLLFVPVVILPAALMWIFFRDNDHRVRYNLLIVPMIIALFINIFWQVNSEALMWRQVNFIDDNVSSIFAFGDGGASSGQTNLVSLSSSELNASPVIELPGSAKNVLLIMLESVSGAYIENAADHQRIESPITMPLLSKTAKTNINFTTFIANQRQTNRGEYTVLCGDYPKLVSEVAKMSEVVFEGANKPCLPGLLNSAGYETVYLQSAPLAFMLKEQFMGDVGFSRVYGNDYFKEAYKRSTWGVDDRAYFEQSVNVVTELARGNKPWFLTMLTVGTHAPYNVPDDYTSTQKKGSIGEAFSYLDLALADFLSELEAKGILKDTLVLLTSDESAGISHQKSDLISKLSQNWGFLVAMVPQGKRMQIDESFMQVDIALSILDYLGLGKVANEFSGRSLFRSYKKQRTIYFANTYMRLVGSLNPAGSPAQLSICNGAFKRCDKYKIDPARPFSMNYKKTEFTETDKDILLEATEQSRAMKKDFSGFELDLITNREISITSSFPKLIFGGQFISIPENTAMDVELDVVGLGGNGRFGLLHDFVSRYYIKSEELGEKHLKQSTPLIGTGDRFKLRYTFYPEKQLNMAESRLFGKVFEGKDVQIKINKAHLSVSPCADRPCMDPGLYIHEMRLNDHSLIKGQ